MFATYKYVYNKHFDVVKQEEMTDLVSKIDYVLLDLTYLYYYCYYYEVIYFEIAVGNRNDVDDSHYPQSQNYVCIV